MSSYRDLIAWQKGMDLAAEVYELTESFGDRERFGLISQMRRCAVSIPSNIAEGHGRLTTKDWQRFLGQARGSAQELETQLILCARLGIAGGAASDGTLLKTEEVCRIINGLLRSTKRRPVRKAIE